ncbi:hypothetical protein VPH35_035844 [Triticum aestivum]
MEPMYSNYSPVRICSAIQFSFISHPGCVQMIGGIANYDQFKCCLVRFKLLSGLPSILYCSIWSFSPPLLSACI